MGDLDNERGPEPEQAEWTATRGIMRGATYGFITMLFLCAATCTLAWFLPLLTLAGALRTAIAFGSAFVLFRVVQRTAGMVGWPCTALAIVYSLIIMFSHHVVFAINGVPNSKGVSVGWQWCSPMLLLFVNFMPIVAIGLCAAFCHRGGFASAELLSLLNTRVR